MIKNNLYGLVLSGGQSRRMGRDKSRLSYHGTSQREWLYHLLRNVCEKVFISVKEKEKEEHLPQIPDMHTFGSPLNGIISALEQHPEKAWLVVSCDMPFLDISILKHLIDHREKEAQVTCFMDSDNQNPEPMIAIWEPNCIPSLRNFIKKDVRPRSFIRSHIANIIQISDKKALTNINTESDYKKAVDDLASKSGRP